MAELQIRPAKFGDHDAIWTIIKHVIASGDTYVFNPDSDKQTMLAYWCGKDKHCYVATEGGATIGTFIIKDNQPGLGSHIANASYMVHPDCQGKGIGNQMANKSLQLAKALGYSAMQFNIVVQTNKPAIKLWMKLGFEVIGEIPKAFDHKQLGLVNAYIMYRKL